MKSDNNYFVIISEKSHKKHENKKSIVKYFFKVRR